MAYLAGGPQRVLDTAIASLVEQGALRVNAVTRELIAEQELSDDRPKIEQRVRGLLAGTHLVADASRFRGRMQRELRTSLSMMRDRLLGAGLAPASALHPRLLGRLYKDPAATAASWSDAWGCCGGAQVLRLVFEDPAHSYWRLFGEHPSIDVWPPAVERFGRDVRWLRVNGGDYWLVPRPRRLWQRFRLSPMSRSTGP